MPLVEFRRDPSPRELRWFGVLLMLFLGALGGLVVWRFAAWRVASGMWIGGLGVALLYYAIRPLRKPIFIAWMAATYPIGLTISTIVLAATYYLVLVPIGLALRACGVRFLALRPDPEAKTYWTAHRPATHVRRYFQQF